MGYLNPTWEQRPNYGNEHDACCRCAKLLPTPKDHKAVTLNPAELYVWQLSPNDPPQWICGPCGAQLTKDLSR